MQLEKLQKMGMFRQIKLVNAYPMTRGEYNDLREWEIPKNENPDDPGMLVVTDEDTDEEHLCWKPLEVFQDSYAEA